MNYKEIYDKEYERVKNAIRQSLFNILKDGYKSEMNFDPIFLPEVKKLEEKYRSTIKSLTKVENELYLIYYDNRPNYSKNKTQNTFKNHIEKAINQNIEYKNINVLSIIQKFAEIDVYSDISNFIKYNTRVFRLIFKYNRFKYFDDAFSNSNKRRNIETELEDLEKNDGIKKPSNTNKQIFKIDNSTENLQRESTKNLLNDDEKLLLLSELFNQTQKGNVKYLEFLKTIAITNNISTIDQVLSKGTGATQYKKFINGLNHYNNTKTKTDYCNSLINVLRSTNVESLITTFKSFLQRKS